MLTVSQINTYIKALLDGDDVLSSVFFSGEISNFTNHIRTGHFYFSLKDENSVIRAVMFRSSNQRLKFQPENGMKVIVYGRISVYEKDGSYQVYVTDMQPDGVGALAKAFEQLKQRLAAEGLFDASRKKAIPKFPKRIGVVTSPTGAAIQDILNILKRRYPIAEVVFAPVLVQGMEAPSQIIKAINRFNELNACDVLIVGRGGGSAEELWAINDEKLARCVAASKIPIISAVGHETDFTLCDFAADLRAETPSAAAEKCVPDRTELLEQIEDKYRRISSSVQSRVFELRLAYEKLAQRKCLTSPKGITDAIRERLDNVNLRVRNAYTSRVERERLTWRRIAEKLEALNPLSVLLRGYAAVTQNGENINKAQQVDETSPVEILMQDGKLHCTVNKKEIFPKADESVK